MSAVSAASAGDNGVAVLAETMAIHGGSRWSTAIVVFAVCVCAVGSVAMFLVTRVLGVLGVCDVRGVRGVYGGPRWCAVYAVRWPAVNGSAEQKDSPACFNAPLNCVPC